MTLIFLLSTSMLSLTLHGFTPKNAPLILHEDYTFGGNDADDGGFEPPEDLALFPEDKPLENDLI
jgi:hypothetical protein